LDPNWTQVCLLKSMESPDCDSYSKTHSPDGPKTLRSDVVQMTWIQTACAIECPFVIYSPELLIVGTSF
jgi:hypothetical protein